MIELEREKILLIKEEAKTRISELVKLTGSRDPAQLVHRALAVYEFFFTERLEGMIFYVSSGVTDDQVLLSEEEEQFIAENRRKK